eukprot:Hpha_TRINITY_DN15896_c0_g1::TRINITY_DN15896_c0_g1_i1::g.191882::m.191882
MLPLSMLVLSALTLSVLTLSVLTLSILVPSEKRPGRKPSDGGGEIRHSGESVTEGLLRRGGGSGAVSGAAFGWGTGDRSASGGTRRDAEDTLAHSVGAA